MPQSNDFDLNRALDICVAFFSVEKAPWSVNNELLIRKPHFHKLGGTRPMTLISDITLGTLCIFSFTASLSLRRCVSKCIVSELPTTGITICTRFEIPPGDVQGVRSNDSIFSKRMTRSVLFRESRPPTGLNDISTRDDSTSLRLLPVIGSDRS